MNDSIADSFLKMLNPQFKKKLIQYALLAIPFAYVTHLHIDQYKDGYLGQGFFTQEKPYEWKLIEKPSQTPSSEARRDT